MIRLNRGFTLIEMMVSVALFSVVMLVGMSSLFTLVSENKRAQALNSVITDLNFTLESMSRTIRTGYAYGCSAVGTDCPGGRNHLRFTTVIDGTEHRVQYRFRRTTSRGYVERHLLNVSTGASQGWVNITSSNVDIKEFDFFLFGASNTDQYQPRVMIALSGTAVSREKNSDFSIQTTITQRVIDL